jgi:hypothetical protein
LKSFVKPRLVTEGTDRGETALGHFRSVWPEFVIRKSARLRVNFAVDEHPVAVLAVQSPLSLRHSVTFWRGAGLAVTDNAKLKPLKMFQIEHRFVLPKVLTSSINRTDNHQIRTTFQNGTVSDWDLVILFQ